jgi:hypothetical protein
VSGHGPCLLLALLVPGLFPGSVALAQEGASEARLVQALADPSFKVRLQAAILIGKRKLTTAAEPLRKSLTDEHETVRAAAALSLGKLGDQASRSGLVAMLGQDNQLVPEAAEKALIMLDQARGKPRYLLSIDPPTAAAGVPTALAPRVRELLLSKLRPRPELELSSGEEKVLQGDRLDEHLKKRELAGILLQPRLAKLQAKRKGNTTTVSCTINVMVTTLVRKRMEFSGAGEADAEVEGPEPSGSDREEIDKALLEAATGAAGDQVLSFLDRRTGP